MQFRFCQMTFGFSITQLPDREIFWGLCPLAWYAYKLNIVSNGGKRAKVKVWIMVGIYILSSSKDTINKDQGDYVNYTVRSVKVWSKNVLSKY